MRIAVLLLLFALPVAAVADEAAEVPENVDKAFALLEALDAGEYDEAIRDFNEMMRDAMTPEEFGGHWEALPQQIGAFQGRGEPRHETVQGYEIVVIPQSHEGMTVDVRVTFDEDGNIAGFHVVPATSPPVRE